MRILILLVAVLALAASLHGGDAPPEDVAVERQKLKDYAFCECLFFVYPEQDPLWINDGSAAGYFETSSYGLQAFDIVRSHAILGAQARADWRSKNGESLGLMKCLDYYNSASLDSLIASLDTLLIVRDQPAVEEEE